MNKQNKDPRLKILAFVGVGLVVFFGFVALASNKQPGEKSTESQAGTPELSLENTRYDFRDIKMSEGKTSHTFEIKNTGGADLDISQLYTSCMCTKASIVIDGKESPLFGMKGMGGSPRFWSEKIAPGQTAELVVEFDPNAHGPNATGPITRIVTLESNSQGKKGSRSSVTITGNVVK